MLRAVLLSVLLAVPAVAQDAAPPVRADPAVAGCVADQIEAGRRAPRGWPGSIRSRPTTSAPLPGSR